MYKLKKVLGITAALTAIPWILQFAFHHYLFIDLLFNPFLISDGVMISFIFNTVYWFTISCVCFVGFLIVSALENFVMESLSSYCDEKFEPKHKEDKK